MGSIQAMIPVASSTIAAIGHDIVTSTLVVDFNNGSRYQYENVSRDKFNTILNAESVGSVFHKEIKLKASEHPYTKVS